MVEQTLSSTFCCAQNPITLRFRGRDNLAVSMLCADHYGWLTSVVKDLEGIQDLSDGWDCGSGLATSSMCVQAAFELFRRVMKPSSPGPRIFPLSNGGLQIEWQVPEALLQVEIDPSQKLSAYYRDPDGDKEFEFSLSEDAAIAPTSAIAPISARLDLNAA